MFEVAFCHNSTCPSACVLRCSPPSTYRRQLAIRPASDTACVGMRWRRARLDRLVEARANPVRLRAPGLRARVLDVLQVEVQRILMRFPIPAIFAAAIGQYP